MISPRPETPPAVAPEVPELSDVQSLATQSAALDSVADAIREESIRKRRRASSPRKPSTVIRPAEGRPTPRTRPARVLFIALAIACAAAWSGTRMRTATAPVVGLPYLASSERTVPVGRMLHVTVRPASWTALDAAARDALLRSYGTKATAAGYRAVYATDESGKGIGWWRAGEGVQFPDP